MNTSPWAVCNYNFAMVTLRWILLLPVTLAAVVLAGTLGLVLGGQAGALPGWMLAGLLSGLTAPFVAVRIAPANQRRTVVTVSWLLLVVAVFSAFTSFDDPDSGPFIAATIAAMVYMTFIRKPELATESLPAGGQQ